MKNKELNHIIDQVTAGIRAELAVDATVSDAAERVWAQLSKEVATSAKMEAAPADRIEGCADFQTFIPAYLRGDLSEARSLLLIDHTHECIPCRKAMKDARTGKAAVKKAVLTPARFSINPVIVRWGIAAALVIGFGLLAIPVVQRYLPFGNFEATVQAAEGQVYQIADSKSTPIAVGQRLKRGDVIRTAKDAHACVRLGDGSIIEVGDR